MDRQIFLARQGVTTGPFDDAKIQEMTESGEIHEYEWIWDGESPDWKPVPRRSKAPPRPEVTITSIQVPPDLGSGTTEDDIPIASVIPQGNATKNTKAKTGLPGKRYSAILYDHEKAFAGKVWKMTDQSAKFLTTSGHHPFKMGQVIWLDLLHEEKDLAYKVRGAIDGLQHSNDGWEIGLMLDQFPL